MATIGVLVPAASGHLNPMNSLGRELARRGHRVVVANVPEAEAADVVERLLRTGRPVPADDFPPTRHPSPS
jgi:zeaxanthin glucosyltransferase